MNTSLSKFCKDTGVPKTTAYKRCQELNFDVASGLTPAMVTTLEHEFGVNPPVDATAPRVSVEVGNHATRKMIHVGATAASLEQFRTQRDRLQLGNRGEFVTHALGFLDQLEEGIEAAEAEQEQELQQIRTAKKQVSKRVEKFRRRADEYRIKSDLLAQIQNTELEDLEDLASELTAMGKPPTAEAATPGAS